MAVHDLMNLTVQYKKFLGIPRKSASIDWKKTCLDALVVERAVDLDVCVRPAVVLALLQVEGVVLVGLVGGAADEAVEDRRFVLDAGTVEGG